MRLFKYLISIILACLVFMYSRFAIPYGWHLWLHSQNYAAGDFGKFMTFSPVIVLIAACYIALLCSTWLDRFKW